MSLERNLTEPAAPTPTNPHHRLVDELKRKHPESITALRAFVNRKKAEREQRRAA